MPLHPRTCSLLYSVSCLLDALDGYAARYFNQSTRFGAVLDMVTDRCTTSCLLVFLSSAFPRWAIVFQGLIALDFSSHYMHMYATLVVGGSDSSHKNIDKSQSWLLNLYYTNKVRIPPITSSPAIEACCTDQRRCSRPFSSSSACSTKSSSLRSTSCPSPRPSSRPTSSRAWRRPVVARSSPASPSTPLSSDKCSPIPSAPRPLRLPEQTRWTPPSPGSSPASASRSCWPSRSSTWSSWSRRAGGLLRLTSSHERQRV